jgi:hypothetical protein
MLQIKLIPQWVAWKWQERDGRSVKVPHDLMTEAAIDAHDSEHWYPYEQAAKIYKFAFDGIGYVITHDDGIIGIDLDDCVDDGKLNCFAQSIVDNVPSYWEISPSGTGIKGYLIGELGDYRSKSATAPIEVYQGRRFFTFTGKSIAQEQIGTVNDWFMRFMETHMVRKTLDSIKVDVSRYTHIDRVGCARRAMKKIKHADGEDGSGRLIRYCRQAVRWALTPGECVALVCELFDTNPSPRDWSDVEIVKRYEQAMSQTQLGEALAGCELPTLANFIQPDKKKIAKPFGELRAEFKAIFGDWPRRVGGCLVVESGRLSSVDAFVAWMQSRCRLNWSSGDGMVTKGEFMRGVLQSLDDLEGIESAPHFPPIDGLLYLHDPVEPRQTGELDRFLDLFVPATEIDRQLIKAFVMTLFWGGGAGKRPMFVITSPDNQQSGKTTLARLVSGLTNNGRPSWFSVSSSKDWERLISHMLEPCSVSRRLFCIDNFKGGSVSGQELESLITSATIDGHVMYVGHGEKRNFYTGVLTGNHLKMSKDMAMRSVEIKIRKPEYSGDWDKKVEQIDIWKLIQDVAWLFELLPQTVQANNWAAWSSEIIGRLPQPVEILQTIQSRSLEVDLQVDMSGEIRSVIEDRLDSLGYQPDHCHVFIPSKTLATWYQRDTGEKTSTRAMGQRISQVLESIPELYRPKDTSHRGVIWCGVAADGLDIDWHGVREKDFE